MSRTLFNDEVKEENFARYLSNNIWVSTLAIIGLMVVLCVGAFVLREICWHKFGIDVCPGAAGNARRRQQLLQEAADEALARQLQEDMQEEVRQQAMIERRKERRAHYEKFLKPYTMVVKQDDFCRCFDEVCFEKASDLNESNRDIESGLTSEDIENYRLAEGAHVMLTLPDSADGRRVEDNCAICLGDYEIGEKVVWSTRDKCAHCFHYECMMSWLSKGKKRCPVCRHFFVPGIAIDAMRNMDFDEEMERPESTEENGDARGEESEASIIQNLRAMRSLSITSHTHGESEVPSGSHTLPSNSTHSSIESGS